MMEKLGAPQTHLGLKNMIKEVDEDFDSKLSFREVSPLPVGGRGASVPAYMFLHGQHLSDLWIPDPGGLRGAWSVEGRRPESEMLRLRRRGDRWRERRALRMREARLCAGWLHPPGLGLWTPRDRSREQACSVQEEMGTHSRITGLDPRQPRANDRGVLPGRRSKTHRGDRAGERRWGGRVQEGAR